MIVMRISAESGGGGGGGDALSTSPSRQPQSSSPRTSPRAVGGGGGGGGGQGGASTSPRPVPVAMWTVEDVIRWLVSAGFADLTPAFRRANVDGAALCQFTVESLKDSMGISALGVRKALLRELATAREQSLASTSPPSRYQQQAHSPPTSNSRYYQ